jgi:4-hydroxy-3-methylbut-2-enyl diphosphate reductase
MEVRLAKSYGFCFGVKRAVDCVLELKGNVNTLGPLIHNPQFVREIEKKGIKSVDSIEKIDSDRVIIRTHGLSDKLINELKKRNLEIIDLTCPFVKKVQDYAKELESKGYQVVIVGEKGHPEVEAIKENLKKGVIINSLKEAKAIGKHDKLGVVAQTTQKLKHFLEIGDELKSHSKNFKLINTICNATQERQEAALELAKQVDIMIVVGGYNSANTKQLKTLCSTIVETKHIETDSDIKKEWFKNKKTAGVTAGASTPDWIIKKTIEKIKLSQ